MLLFLAAAAAATSSVPFSDAEPTCVIEEMKTRELAKTPYKLAEVVSPCKSRYQWTQQDVDLALKVTRTLVMVTNSRAEAHRAGLNVDEIQAAYDKLSYNQLEMFGWEGNPRPIPDALMETTHSVPSLKTEDDHVKGGAVVLWLAVAHNSIKAFIDHRKKQPG